MDTAEIVKHLEDEAVSHHQQAAQLEEQIAGLRDQVNGHLAAAAQLELQARQMEYTAQTSAAADATPDTHLQG